MTGGVQKIQSLRRAEVHTTDRALYWILAAALGLRIVLAGLTKGYGPDMSCFLAWGEKALQGLPEFYSEGYFADYTPGYIYVLALIAAVRRLFHIDYYARASMILLALIPAVCDGVTTALIYAAGRQHMTSRSALLRLTAFAAFCPAVLFDTAIWKQIDGVFMLPIILCLLCLEQGKYYRAALFWGIAFAIKPQALLLGPVMAAAYVMPLLNGGKDAIGTGPLASFSQSHTPQARQIQKDASGPVPIASFPGQVLRIPVGIVIALAPALLSGIPFFGFRNLIPGLIAKYTETSGSYPYASVDAFNFFAMCGGNWVDQNGRFVLGASWRSWGIFNLVVITAAMVILMALMWEKDPAKSRFSPTLLAAFYTVGIFTFSHRMHERYLVMGVLIALLAAALWDDLVLFFAAAGLSLTSFLNIASVYAVADTEDSFLLSDTSQEFVRIVGAAETLFFLILAVRIFQLAMGRQKAAIPDTQEEPWTEETRVSKNKRPAAGAIRTRELAAVAVLTVVAAILGFSYLGDTKAPETAAGDYTGTVDIPFTAAFTAEDTPVTIRVYPEICWDNASLTVTSDTTGDVVAEVPLGYTTIFTWQKADFNGEGEGTAFTAHITNAAVLEAALYDSEGNLLPAAVVGDRENSVESGADAAVTEGLGIDRGARPISSDADAGTISSDTGAESISSDIGAGAISSGSDTASIGTGAALFDEQDLVPTTFSRLNSMYFDEVYHGRTAYEMAHRLTVYETTHPPLGKDLIMFAIMLFGMNAFAWRAAPALFGVLLVPLLYLFVKKLTGNGRLAVFAAALSVTDFMRYVESRLATIDIFTTFFILLSAYFMLDYAQKAEQQGVRRTWLPALLSGIAFGLGVSVKWNAAYAGIGLAAVYFLTLYRRRKQAAQVQKKTDVQKERSIQRTVCGTQGSMFRTVHGQADGNAAAFDEGKGQNKRKTASSAFRSDLAFTLLYGVLFFIAVPILIYLASYFPYRWRDPSFGFRDWWNCQVSMYQYHSTNDATNPFSSNWYTWPLLLRPYWYYADYELPAGTVSSIASVGNVVTWTGGMIAMLYLFWQQLRGKGSRAARFLLVFWIGQLLPWILVTRTTYAYHYLPLSTFGIAAIALALQEGGMGSRTERNAVTPSTAAASGVPSAGASAPAASASAAGNARNVRNVRIAVILLAISTLLFILFFPILSGLPVSSAYGHGLEVLKSWAFYL